MRVSRELETRKKDKKGFCPIIVVACWQGKRLRISSKCKCLASSWNKARQNVKEKDAASQEINKVLDMLEDAIRRAYSSMLLVSDDISKQELSLEIENKLRSIKGIVDRPSAPCFSEYFDVFLKENNSTFSKNTLAGYISTSKLFSMFCGDVKVNQVNASLIRAYLNFLADEDVTNSSVKIYFGRLLSILESAKRHFKGKFDIDIDSIKSIKLKSNDHSEKVFLLLPELEEFHKARLSDKLQLILNSFLISCYTGVRYSDLIRLSGSLKSDKFELSQKKTKDKVSVVLSEYAKDVLSRQSDLLEEISRYSYSYYNQGIKEVAKQIGCLNYPVKISRVVGSDIKDEYVNKEDLISTHSGRVTFATQSLARGMKIEVLQKVLGHRSINSTMVYAKILDEAKNEQMLKAWSK